MGSDSGEREERRAEAVAHRATVVKAYHSGRSTARYDTRRIRTTLTATSRTTAP